MTPSPFFSARIPQDLYNAVNKRIAETKESRTQILINALSAYVNHEFEPPATANAPIEERLSQIEEKLKEIDELVGEVSALKQQVNSRLEQIDNTIDNTIDNKLNERSDYIPSPGQLSLLAEEPVLNSTDNIIDNTSDNNRSQKTPTKKPRSRKRQESPDLNTDEWEILGKMHLPDIVERDEFKDWDLKKLKQDIRNANVAPSKTKVIEPFRFVVLGKEGSGRGQYVFEVSRRKPPADWV